MLINVSQNQNQMSCFVHNVKVWVKKPEHILILETGNQNLALNSDQWIDYQNCWKLIKLIKQMDQSSQLYSNNDNIS